MKLESDQITPYFEKSKVDWKIKTTSSLLDFWFHTKQYINNFNFAGADGLDNFKSNLHTLLKECYEELRIRGINPGH